MASGGQEIKSRDIVGGGVHKRFCDVKNFIKFLASLNSVCNNTDNHKKDIRLSDEK